MLEHAEDQLDLDIVVVLQELYPAAPRDDPVPLEIFVADKSASCT